MNMKNAATIQEEKFKVKASDDEKPCLAFNQKFSKVFSAGNLSHYPCYELIFPLSAVVVIWNLTPFGTVPKLVFSRYDSLHKQDSALQVR